MKAISVGALAMRMIIFMTLIGRVFSHAMDTAHSFHNSEMETGRKEGSHFIASHPMEHSQGMLHQHNGSEGGILQSTSVDKDSYRKPFQHADMEQAESEDRDHDDPSVPRSEHLDSDASDLTSPSSDQHENGRWNNTPEEDEHAPELSEDDSTKEQIHQFTRNDFFSILGLIMLSSVFATVVTFTFLAFMRIFMQFLSRNIVTEELQ